MTHETQNRIPVTEKFNQFVNSTVFKYVNDQYRSYLKKIFEIALETIIQTRGSFKKLKCPFHKTSADLLETFYIGPTIWSKTSEKLNRTKYLNAFKHNLIELKNSKSL